jgi:hypothetical protein
MHTVGTGKWRTKLKKSGKWKKHTIGPGIWQENRKMRKMRNTHGRTWNMPRNNEKRAK